MGKEQFEKKAEGEENLEDLSLIELEGLKKELGEEWKKCWNEREAAQKEAEAFVKEKYPEFAETFTKNEPESIEGLSEKQKKALEEATDITNFGQKRDAVLSIDTSRMPFIDRTMKKIKEIMQSPQIAKIAEIDKRWDEVSKRDDRVREQIEIKKIKEKIAA